MTEKMPKKTEIPFETFSDPACEVRDGKRVAPTAKVYEPHDYNRKLLESQRARGVRANIPQLPTLGRTHTVAIKKPPQLDLIAKAKAIRAAASAAQEAFDGAVDVLPDNSIPFEELDG